MRFNYQIKHEDLHLNLTPLIDVVFLLIIFFLVTSSFVKVSGVRVKLPHLVSSDSMRKANVVVEIDPSGKYSFEDNPISFQGLQDKIKDLEKETQMTISADKAVPFDFVMKIWDLARDHGLKEVVVLTSRE